MESPSLKIPGNQKYSTCVINTLGIAPISEISMLRDIEIPLNIRNYFSNDTANTHVKSSHYELHALFDVNQVSQEIGKFGFKLRASDDLSEQTFVYYDMQTSSVMVDCSHCSLSDLDLYPPIEGGPIQLFNILKNHTDIVIEPLDMKIFVDNSVIEVFVNGRFAVTTRMFPILSDSIGIYFYKKEMPMYPIVSSTVYPITTQVMKDRPLQNMAFAYKL
jgi:beta-fructofuranosidase